MKKHLHYIIILCVLIHPFGAVLHITPIFKYTKKYFIKYKIFVRIIKNIKNVFLKYRCAHITYFVLVIYCSRTPRSISLSDPNKDQQM